MSWAKRTGIELVIGGKMEPTVGQTMTKVQSKAEKLGQSLARVRLGQGISGEVVKYRKAIEKLKAKQDKQQSTNEKVNQALKTARERLKSAEQAATRYGLDVGRVAQEHRRLTREVERTERAMARAQAKQRNREKRSQLLGRTPGLGKVAGGLGGAVGVGAAFKSAVDFDSAQVRLRTVINTDESQAGAAVDAARKSALEFARTGLSKKTEVLDVNYALNSAGLSAEASRLGASVVLKTAKITSGVPEQVGEVVATTYNNLGKSLEGTTQEKIARIGDLLAKTQFKFQIRDFGQLGESLKMATPSMVANNVSLEQGLTLLGQLNSSGMQGSMAGTALSASMRQMSKASKEFGFEIERTADGQLDFISTVQNLSDSIGGFDNLEQETIDRLQTAFGDEGVRAVQLLGGKLEELKAAQKDVAEGSKGLVDKSYKLFLDSASGKLARFSNSMDLVGSGLANTLLPGVNAVLTPITTLTMKVGELVEKFPLVGQAVGGAAAAFVAFKAAKLGVGLGKTVLSDMGQTAKGGADFFRYRGWSKGGRERMRATGRGQKARGGLVGNLARQVLPGLGSGGGEIGPLPLPVRVVNLPGGGLGGSLDSGGWGGGSGGKTGKGRTGRASRAGGRAGLGRRILGRGRGLGRAVLGKGGALLGGLEAASALMPSLLPSVLPSALPAALPGATAGVAAKAAPKAATKTIGKAVAGKGVGAVGKAALKGGAKGLGKSVLKKIPLIGALAGGIFAVQRAIKGDWVGALGEAASGAVSIIPGLGTAASLAIDGALVAKDVMGRGGGDSVPGATVVQDRERAEAREQAQVREGKEPGPGQAPERPSAVVRTQARPKNNINIRIQQTVNLAQGLSPHGGMTEPGIKQVLNEGRVELERHLEDWFERYLQRRQELSFA